MAISGQNTAFTPASDGRGAPATTVDTPAGVGLPTVGVPAGGHRGGVERAGVFSKRRGSTGGHATTIGDVAPRDEEGVITAPR